MYPEELRTMVFNQAGGLCVVCGVQLDWSLFQMAHRIPQRKYFLKKYTKAVIHHPKNLAATCGLRCNNAVSIGNHPIEIQMLVEDILYGEA